MNWRASLDIVMLTIASPHNIGKIITDDCLKNVDSSVDNTSFTAKHRITSGEGMGAPEEKATALRAHI
jgi:hypothetical protein